MDALKNLRDFDRDDLLRALGLEARRQPAEVAGPLMAMFGAGLLVGAGLGLLLAPKPGHRLRKELGKRVADVHSRAVEAIEEARS